MTSPGMDRSNELPRTVDVKVNNFPESPRARKTTMLTVVLDPAASDPTARRFQIGEYEPLRIRTVLQVLDQPCILIVGETPRNSPDLTVAATAPQQGRVLPVSTEEYVLYGPDVFWLNTITAATVGRVTVTKEYL